MPKTQKEGENVLCKGHTFWELSLKIAKFASSNAALTSCCFWSWHFVILFMHCSTHLTNCLKKSQTSTLVHRDFLFSPPKEGKKQQERKKEKVSNLQLCPNCKAWVFLTLRYVTYVSSNFWTTHLFRVVFFFPFFHMGQAQIHMKNISSHYSQAKKAWGCTNYFKKAHPKGFFKKKP